MDFYGKIEDPSGLPENVQAIETVRLISGKEITHPVFLKGGGQVYKKYFLKAIGNKKYENAYEWCAGHGEIGYEILTAGICNTLAFSDLHPKSTEWCLKNAGDLGLADKVSAYTSSTISALPESTKWDLVVGNPPNAMGVDPTVLNVAKQNEWSHDQLLLYTRTTWDIGLEAHADFFKNIGIRTTQDVDIFITVNNTVLKHVESIAQPCGFTVVDVFDMFPDPYPEYHLESVGSPTDPGLKVVHFKKI